MDEPACVSAVRTTPVSRSGMLSRRSLELTDRRKEYAAVSRPVAFLGAFLAALPVKATQDLKGGVLRRVHDVLASWISTTAPTLPIARFGRYVAPIRPVLLADIPFPVSLHRTTKEGFPARFTIRHIVDGNQEAQRVDPMREACERKFPSSPLGSAIAACAQSWSSKRTTPSSQTSKSFAHALLEVEKTTPDPPDEVYFVSRSRKIPGALGFSGSSERVWARFSMRTRKSLPSQRKRD